MMEHSEDGNAERRRGSSMLSAGVSPGGAQAVDEDELEPVEGLKAWLNVLGSFLTHFFALGVTYSFSLFVKPYEAEFDVGRASVSFVYQLQVAVLMLFGFLSGRIADSFGVARAYRFGVIMLSSGLLLGSFAQEFWQMVLTHGFMVGLGNAFVYWPAITVIPQWFNKRRALASGVAVLGAGVGNFGAGVSIAALLETGGFRYALRVMSATAFTVLALSSFLLKRRLPPVKGGSLCKDSDVLRSRNFRFIVASALFFQTGYNVPFAHLSPYVQELDFETSFAALAVGMVGVGSSVGRILLGFFADRFGRILCFKLCMLGTAVACIVWYFSQTQATILFFSLFFGFMSGGFIALVPVVMSEFYGVHRMGAVMGYVALFLVPGSILGPLLGGSLYDSSGNYDNTIIFCASTVGLAVLLLLGVDNQPPDVPLGSEEAAESTRGAAKSVEA